MPALLPDDRRLIEAELRKGGMPELFWPATLAAVERVLARNASPLTYNQQRELSYDHHSMDPRSNGR